MSSSESWVKTRIPYKWVKGFQLQGGLPVQEDYFEINADRGIFILADGFGGSSGKVAAEIAVKAVRQFLEQEAGDLDATLPFELRPYYSLAGNVLFNAIAFANQKLMLFNKDHNWMSSGGASLIAGYLEGRLLAVANVGTCNLHLCRQGKSKEIVVPRSLAKQVNPFADEMAEGAGVPLISLGTARQLEPEVVEIELREGDQLCFQTAPLPAALRERLFQLESSDGLSQIIDEQARLTPPQGNASLIWTAF
jgi:serine/threonine protein phosphatase PrpC